MMRIAITGHRPSKLGNDYDLTSPLVLTIKHTLQNIINYYSTRFARDMRMTEGISGVALGIDTVWAELVLENNLPLIAAIPCMNHSSKWNQDSVERYLAILTNPLTTGIIVNKEPYKPRLMQLRNQWMVDQLGDDGLLIAVWDGSKGGTANCVAYAHYRGLIEQGRVIRIDPATPDKYEILKSMQ